MPNIFKSLEYKVSRRGQLLGSVVEYPDEYKSVIKLLPAFRSKPSIHIAFVWDGEVRSLSDLIINRLFYLPRSNVKKHNVAHFVIQGIHIRELLA